MVRINAIAISISALFSPALAGAQESDSLRTSRLDEVVIQEEKLFTIERLPDIQGKWLNCSGAFRI